MLDYQDVDTVFALRTLRETVFDTAKQVALWIGAGASQWCGYPGWDQLAQEFHVAFKRHAPNYDHSSATAHLEAGRLPAVFSLCRAADSARYSRALVQAFAPKPPSPVYQRLTQALSLLQPQHILTTNIDETLTKAFPLATAVSRANVERLPALVASRTSFVASLHGTISDVSSVVFTDEDYATLVSDQSFQGALQHILRECSVLFIGYGLRDDYVLKVIQRNNDLGKTFGDGPHFAVLPDAGTILPASVKRIRYSPDGSADHRSAISVLEEVTAFRKSEPQRTPSVADSPRISGHLLYELFPPGTWNTTQVLTVSGGGKDREIVVGDGMSSEELPDNRSRALHDLVVGLVCFDTLFAPVWAAGRLHAMLGGELFWRLTDAGVLRLLWWTDQFGMVFQGKDDLAGGQLNQFSVMQTDGQPDTPGRTLRQQLGAVPGKEAEANKHISRLEERIVHIETSAVRNVLRKTYGLLLRPSIRDVLGISQGSSVMSIARWQTFPVMRLATLVKVADTCAHLGLSSARVNIGAAGLAGPAFSISVGAEMAEDTAGYVVAGGFASDLGALAEREPAVLQAVVAFRDTEMGTKLRREIFARLSVREGHDAALAINEALREAIPVRILQEARDEMTKLFISRSATPRVPTAFWSDITFAERALSLWRDRSRRMFGKLISERGIQTYDQCPCGSGEKMKFCCASPTRKA